MEGSFFSRALHLDKQASQDAWHLVWPWPPIRDEYLEVREKAEVAVHLWSRKKITLKGKAEVCFLHMYPILLRLLVLPLPYTELILLVQILFHLLWVDKAPKVCHKVCCLHLFVGGLGMPSVKIHQQTQQLKFLDRMCLQDEEDTEKVWWESLL